MRVASGGGVAGTDAARDSVIIGRCHGDAAESDASQSRIDAFDPTADKTKAPMSGDATGVLAEVSVFVLVVLAGIQKGVMNE